jgi:hypothetical protein
LPRERADRAPLPLAEVGTNPDRIATWGKEYAVAANKVVSNMGIERNGLVEEPLVGYVSQYLDGIWLRAPYLHNGSVPTLRDLLKPVDERPQVFYRGYDLYDPVNAGFVSSGYKAEKVATNLDAKQPGNGNEGHLFGVDLSDADKDALVEYLKTL